MNEMTKALFEAIEANSEASFLQIKALFKASQVLHESNVEEPTIDLKALLKIEDGTYSLISYAVYQVNDQACDLLLAEGADINVGNPTPLVVAIKQNNCEKVLQLIAMGADVNIGNPLPLITAIEHNSLAIVTKLIDEGANVELGEPSPLCVAIEKKAVVLVNFLIDQGAQVNQQTSKKINQELAHITREAYISNKKYYYPAETITRTIEITISYTPLHAALTQNIMELIELLLFNDADIKPKRTYKSAYGFHALEDSKQFNDQSCADISRTHDYNTSALIQKLFVIIDAINFAKKCYVDGNKEKLLTTIGKIYTEGSVFFLKYLAYKIKNINRAIYREKIEHHYILNFIKIFCFIAQEVGHQIELEKLKLLQELVLPELLGHDPENPNQQWPIFSNLEEKNRFIDSISQGTSWEKTRALMSNSPKVIDEKPTSDSHSTQKEIIHDSYQGKLFQRRASLPLLNTQNRQKMSVFNLRS